MTYGGLTLEQLRALESAATPGPWLAQREYDGARTVCQMRACDQLVCINRATHVQGNTWEATRENAALIAAARNALPDLLREVEKLRAVCLQMAELEDMALARMCAAAQKEEIK